MPIAGVPLLFYDHWLNIVFLNKILSEQASLLKPQPHSINLGVLRRLKNTPVRFEIAEKGWF